ncbi:MAG: aldose 1-epimerase [Planctomycetaceae bacterium]|nr:aldose 1-epimerase [Planctomycetaceae bacterium]
MKNTIELTNNRSGANTRIMPEAGFNFFSLRIPVGNQTVDVLDCVPEFATTGERPTRSGIPLLFPYPNRIREGRFTWEGRQFDLTGAHHDESGNAIHGLVVDRPWRVVAQSARHVVGQFQLSVDAPDRWRMWPADFLIEVGYELFEQALRCDIRVFNPDVGPLPWGFGTHPYFRVPLSSASRRNDCLVQVPAALAWELNECLPTGRQLPVAGRNDLRDGEALADVTLDDVLTGLAIKNERVSCVVMDPGAGLQIAQVTDAVFRELVAFTPPHGRSVCLEPYTCVTDAINLVSQGHETGLQVLMPGCEFHTWFEIHAGLVYA